MAGEGLQPLGNVSWRARHGEESGPQWTLGMVQEVYGLCAVPSGAEAEEPLQTRKEGHE